MSDPLPHGWTWTTLGEAFRWGSGGTPSSGRADYYGGQIPWVVIGDLTDGLVSETTNTITEAGLQNSSAKWVEEGSVLVAMYGSIGKLGIANRRLTTNQAIAFTDPHPVETRYLYWYLASVRDDLIGRGKGGAQQNISQTVLKAVPFPLAPLGEQRRIVVALEEHLSDLDAAVAGLERVRANVKRWQAADLLAALRGVSLDRIIGDGPRPWPLPATWRWETVDAVGDVLLGRQRAPQYLTGRYLHPYLRVANVGDDVLRLEDVKEMDFDEQHAAKYMLRPGDILVSEGQSPELVGQSAVYRGEIPGACFQKTLHRFRAHPDRVLPEFAQLVFRSFVKSGVFQRHASLTVNIAHLTLERFKAVPFPLPPINEQRAIVDEVHRRSAVANRTAADVDLQLARAARLRQAILQRAFSGRLVAQDPGDEPALALLARLGGDRTLRSTAAPRTRGRPRAARTR